MSVIYIVEDDKNISEIESYALKTAGIRWTVLRMQKHSGADARSVNRIWYCWM